MHVFPYRQFPYACIKGDERVAAFKAINFKNGRFVHSCRNELFYDCSSVLQKSIMG